MNRRSHERSHVATKRSSNLRRSRLYKFLQIVETCRHWLGSLLLLTRFRMKETKTKQGASELEPVASRVEELPEPKRAPSPLSKHNAAKLLKEKEAQPQERAECPVQGRKARNARDARRSCKSRSSRRYP